MNVLGDKEVELVPLGHPDALMVQRCLDEAHSWFWRPGGCTGKRCCRIEQDGRAKRGDCRLVDHVCELDSLTLSPREVTRRGSAWLLTSQQRKSSNRWMQATRKEKG